MSILYTFVLEQYVIAYFWLITCIYAICTNKQDELVLAGAGGTLLTSLLLTFWIPKEFSFKKLGKYILNLVKVGVVFGYLILLFGRLDSILPKTIKVKKEVFSNFVDKNVDEKEDIESNKFKQYTIFIKNCFVSPKTIEITRGDIQSDYHFQAIHMENAKKYDVVGISIFILSLLGFVVSRKEKISQIAGVWIIFSLAILGFIGWGSKENGLILYILYFGWAFLTLIFQLLKYIFEKIKSKYLIEIAIICLIVLCVVGNYGGVKDLLNFAFKNYPANIILIK